MAKKIITIIGKTSDDRSIIDGVWKIFETHGIPLDIIFTMCIDKNVMPDWIVLYKQMKRSGMSHDRIVSKLDESISDSYGKIFNDAVISQLNKIFK